MRILDKYICEHDDNTDSAFRFYDLVYIDFTSILSSLTVE